MMMSSNWNVVIVAEVQKAVEIQIEKKSDPNREEIRNQVFRTLKPRRMRTFSLSFKTFSHSCWAASISEIEKANFGYLEHEPTVNFSLFNLKVNEHVGTATNKKMMTHPKAFF